MNDEAHGADAPVPDLDRLYESRMPSPELEERVMEDFRSQALPAEKRNVGWRPRSVLLQAAAAVVVFLAGWTAGASTGSERAALPGAAGPASSQGGETGPSGSEAGAASAAPAGPTWAFLLWDEEGLQADADPAEVADRYAAWARSVARSGVEISGEELGAERVVVGSARPPSAGSARVGGFFLLNAETLGQARSLAEGHPHVAAGGVIEIAPVVRR